MVIITETELIELLENNRDGGEPVRTTLETDKRIIARVTDGIYRQPAAALRELISNAYDADATKVIIHTDAPRFKEIRIIDNGNGISREGLAFLIKHIGGSAKRTKQGKAIGIANTENVELSPGGRKLIGKIGIGLFSISQLSHHFKIITKVKGESFRLIINVTLKTYTEEDLKNEDPGTVFDTGEVMIDHVPADDIDAHGTEIIIMDLPGKTLDELRSINIWEQVDFESPDEIKEPRKPPAYHIGRPEKSNKDLMKTPAIYPWENDDNPEARFRKLYNAVIDHDSKVSNIKLVDIFDNYFRMLWKLSLSVPVNYIDIHPFDITSSEEVPVFKLGNKKKSQAEEIALSTNQKLRDAVPLKSPERGNASEFEVILDGIKLMRPTKIKNGLMTHNAIKTPLIFVGHHKTDLSSVPENYRGGGLEFEAYFIWTPKVVPVENRGVLIRINDSSGATYDETFMQYPVSEQARLRQITAEVFVLEGLDPALNIDRESFNIAHPHYQVIMKWTHNALRQIANRNKAIAKEIRNSARAEQSAREADEFDKYVKKQLDEVKSDELAEIPKVKLVKKRGQISLPTEDDKREGILVFDKDKVLSGRIKPIRETEQSKIEEKQFEKKVEALIQLLETAGVFEGLAIPEQEDLVMRIANIFGYEFEGNK